MPEPAAIDTPSAAKTPVRGRLIDVTGRRFGRWTVLALYPDRYRFANGTFALWLCRCDCGIERVVLGGSLRRGASKSCGGCGRVKHGHCRNGRPTRIYEIWHSMMQRCCNPNHRAYANYGGRGISVCERWQTFVNFYGDVGDPPPDRSIDRIDNSRGYEPGNVRWATPAEQVRNRRPSKRKRRRSSLADIQAFAAALARAPSGGVRATP